MKNWLRRKLLSFMYPDDDLEPISIEIDDDTIDWPDPVTFKIQKANGGNIVEVKYYNRKNDERYTAIHIIPQDHDLQTGLAKIMTYESLKK